MSGKSIQDANADRTINVLGGDARYICTEVEDANGRFNDMYSSRDGYWLTHDGNLHHVYYRNPNAR